ncbi:methyltransferase [Streptomyces sp. NPDC059122]|uniref:methyltransferase n=2 Tax=unclassified Streptomyces TaxID=2593676 RepID=UPI00367D1B3A
MTEESPTMNKDTMGAPEADTDAATTLRTIITSYIFSQIVRATAQLGITEHLADGPRSVDALAEAIDADPDALRRFLRSAASLDLVREKGDTFELGPLGAAMEADHGRLKSVAMGIVGPNLTRRAEGFAEVVRAGRRVNTQVDGYEFWEYYDHHEEEAEHYAVTMSHVTAHCAQALVRQYDFSGFKRIADVGGGHGNLLNGVLTEVPDVHGVLYERAEVNRRAKALFTEAGTADRVELIDGNFLQEIPGGCDLYMIKSTLCDWDDENAARIVGNIHRAAEPGATLVVVDSMIADEVTDDEVNPVHAQQVSAIDFAVFATNGGKVRPQSEYRTMIDAAGFDVESITPFFDGFTHWNLLVAKRR